MLEERSEKRKNVMIDYLSDKLLKLHMMYYCVICSGVHYFGKVKKELTG